MAQPRGDQQKLLAAALKKLERLKLNECFDPVDPESRPTKAQQEVINDFGKIRLQYIVAGNQSGKSQTCSRIVSWVVQENHPTWTRPAAWGEEPLKIVVAGRTGKQIEESLWPKIRSYLEPGTYKEVRIGNILQKVELDGGNHIIFQSLENPRLAAERIQSYVAHLFWIDEMPPTTKILSEAITRVNTRSGYLLASFTPLVENFEIQKMVDAAAAPYSKKYQFKMFDNPAYSSHEKQAEVMASMSALPEHVRNTRLFGDWSSSESAVYYFDYEEMIDMPNGYSPMWRHIESVDPALKSALGLTVWAEDPSTGIWYAVMAEYVKGILVPTEIVSYVKERTKNLNIIKRIADPHEVWYIQTARSMGINYIGVYKKNDRKAELMKQFQEKLGKQIKIAPHLSDFVKEIEQCRWSDRSANKIANSSSYHLLDSAHYFCDNLPKFEPTVAAKSHHEWLYLANEKRKQTEEKIKKKLAAVQVRRGTRW